MCVVLYMYVYVFVACLDIGVFYYIKGSSQDFLDLVWESFSLLAISTRPTR